MYPIRVLRAAALAVSCCAMPATAQTSARQGSISIPFERMTLPNGLEVVLAPDHTVPQVAVDIWYHVGSKNEIAGRTGFAHMFEHTMFIGSGHAPYGMHDRLTEGVSGIRNNASTSNDATNYYEVVPPNYLETVLWLESDRMGYLLDKLDETKFVAQREIVQNERRQTTDDQPFGRIDELIDYALYPENHVYSWPVVGYMSDLKKASVEDVKSFFRLYYAPSNATLAIVGDFDPAQAKAMVRTYFGELSAGATIVRPKVTVPPLTSEKRLTFEDHVQVPRLFLAWPTVGNDNSDINALQVLSQVLAGPRTARLTKALVYEQLLATNASVYNTSYENAGNLLLAMTPRPGNTLTMLEAAADAVIEHLKTEGPTPIELAKAQAGLEYAFVSKLQSNLRKAEILNEGMVYHGDAAYYQRQFTELKAITAADVKRVANKYLGAGRVVLSVVPAGKPEQAAKADVSTKVTVAPDGGHYISGVR